MLGSPRGSALDEIDYFKPVFISYNPHAGSGNYKCTYVRGFFVSTSLSVLKFKGFNRGFAVLDVGSIRRSRALPRQLNSKVPFTFEPVL